MDFLNFNSVENVPGIEARAAFTINSATVFTPSGRGYFVVKEDVDIIPTIIDETLSYIPWGGDNQLPFNIIDLIEKDVIAKRFRSLRRKKPSRVMKFLSQELARSSLALLRGQALWFCRVGHHPQ